MNNKVYAEDGHWAMFKDDENRINIYQLRNSSLLKYSPYIAVWNNIQDIKSWAGGEYNIIWAIYYKTSILFILTQAT